MKDILDRLTKLEDQSGKLKTQLDTTKKTNKVILIINKTSDYQPESSLASDSTIARDSSRTHTSISNKISQEPGP